MMEIKSKRGREREGRVKEGGEERKGGMELGLGREKWGERG